MKARWDYTYKQTPIKYLSTHRQPNWEIFNTIATHREENPCKTILPIILTDGYASYDGLNHDPGDPLLWVICPGGVENHTLPFGDVARITR